MKIVSGGQTGADRAALDFALSAGLPHGGYVPNGRWAEDGPIAARYDMAETASDDVAVRTVRNVETSDATLIVTHGEPTGGTLFTLVCARRTGKPYRLVDLDRQPIDDAAAETCAWLEQVRPASLNIAGPRASIDPVIYDATLRLLEQMREIGAFG